MQTQAKELNANEVNWPVVNGEIIDTAALKKLDFSVIILQFRLASIPYDIGGIEVDIPIPIPMFEIRRKGLQKDVLARGGYTTVKVTKKGVTVVGESKCNPAEHFNRSVGIKLATADAVKQLQKLNAL